MSCGGWPRSGERGDSAKRETAQLAHHCTNVIFRRDKKYFVISFNLGVAFRKDRLAPPKDRRDAGLDIWHVFTQLTQIVAHQRPAVIRLQTHQLHFAPGEIQHL